MPDRAALLVSLAICLAGAVPLAGRLAARGVGANLQAGYDSPLPDASAPTLFDVPVEQKVSEARPGGRAVCVRLCDGFFFPSATSSDGDAACQSQCPDAQTVRYTEALGSDRIEEAVSLHGAPYTALATSAHYRTTLDLTCSCHRSAVRSYSYSVLNDSTLRKGDVVMTPKGLLVFQGAKGRSITSADFVALSDARSLPPEQRAALGALEGHESSQPAGAAALPAGALTAQTQASIPLASASGTQ